jgi:hypothetical protein
MEDNIQCRHEKDRGTDELHRLQQPFEGTGAQPCAVRMRQTPKN